MRISPEKFFVKRLTLGNFSDFGITELDQPLSLKVAATKESRDIVRINLYLRLKIDKEELIEVDYAVDFTVSDPSNSNFELNDELIEHKFMQINAPAIAYPYLRAFVSSLCVTAGYGGVIIPAVNFAALYDERVKTGRLKESIHLNGVED